MLINKEHLLSQLDGRPEDGWISVQAVKAMIEAEPSIDAEPVVRCKDCKHKPKRLEEGEGEGLNLEFPNDTFRCPCRCDDGWYNWMPDDNWFCGNGERKES